MHERHPQLNSGGQEPWVQPQRRNRGRRLGSPLVAVGLLLAGAQLRPSITLDRVKNSTIEITSPKDPQVDDYYPNDVEITAGNYLTGVNNISPTKSIPAMLRFQNLGLGAWRQYNSVDGCNYDSFQWLKTGLRYLNTVNACNIGQKTVISYLPGVTIMPPSADQTSATSGESYAVYEDNGKITCAGINRWITALKSVTSNEIDIQNNQTTTWTKGADPSGCGAGKDTSWQDTYKLGNIPVAGTNKMQLGLKEEIGGDMARFAITGNWDYDVKFAQWQKLQDVSLSN